MSTPVNRGDVFYVTRSNQTIGSEQQAGRPAVVVSNDLNNAHSPVVEVVYLTTQPKSDLPTHCTIRSTNALSTALCEQVHSIYKDRLDSYLCTVTDQELAAIDRCLLTSLGLDSLAAPTDPQQVTPATDYGYIKAERDFYERQYNKLLEKLMEAR